MRLSGPHVTVCSPAGALPAMLRRLWKGHQVLQSCRGMAGAGSLDVLSLTRLILSTFQQFLEASSTCNVLPLPSAKEAQHHAHFEGGMVKGILLLVTGQIFHSAFGPERQ